LQNVTSAGSRPRITLTATTRIVISCLSAVTIVKQNRIIAARMNAGTQLIKEKSIMDSFLPKGNKQQAIIILPTVN